MIFMPCLQDFLLSEKSEANHPFYVCLLQRIHIWLFVYKKRTDHCGNIYRIINELKIKLLIHIMNLAAKYTSVISRVEFP